MFISFGVEAAVGGWVELGRFTAGSTTDALTVSSLADKRYIMVLSDAIQLAAANINVRRRIGNGGLDSGSNYAARNSTDFGSDSTTVNQTSIPDSLAGASAADTHIFDVGYWDNLSGKEKEMMDWQTNVQALGVGTAPRFREIVGKSTLLSVIDIIGVFNDDGGDYKTGSELLILGWSPPDVHTNNFFEEQGSASGSTLDITLSTARKWTWTQFLVRAGSASTVLKLRAGNGSLDSTNLYAFRQSDDGDSGATSTTTDGITLNVNSLAANELLSVNIFMVNISALEKLWIINVVDTNAGLGASNAPGRNQIVAKYVFTSNLVDHIGVVATSGSISATSSQGKSWGGD